MGNPLKELFEKRGAVYRPTPADVVDRMLLLAAPRRDELLYDLGCGDGRVVIAAARRFGCRAVGVESEPERVREARKNVARAGPEIESLVRIVEGDLYRQPLDAADVVTLYLSPEPNRLLVPELRKLRPGARIVSHDFGLDGIPAHTSVTMTSEEDGKSHAIHLWRAPLACEEPFE